MAMLHWSAEVREHLFGCNKSRVAISDSSCLCCLLQRGHMAEQICEWTNFHFIYNFCCKCQILMFMDQGKISSTSRQLFCIPELLKIEILAFIFTNNFTDNFLKHLRREHMQHALYMFYIFSQPHFQKSQNIIKLKIAYRFKN